ncbi:MAG TPA: hypothetical protein VF278_02010 [Pirellulales bacterium]
MYRAERQYRNARLTAGCNSTILLAGSVCSLLLALGGNGWANLVLAMVGTAGAAWMFKARNRRRPHWLEIAHFNAKRRASADKQQAAAPDERRPSKCPVEGEI